MSLDSQGRFCPVGEETGRSKDQAALPVQEPLAKDGGVWPPSMVLDEVPHRKESIMSRVLSFCLVAVALALFVSSPVLAEDAAKNADKTAAKDKADQGNTHEGTVVSVTGNKLSMRGKGKDGQEGKEHEHTLSATAKVTIDGKSGQLTDLKPGQKIRVTMDKTDKTMVSRVEALDQGKSFEGSNKNKSNKDSNK
jgi:hypothetical protein